MSADIQDVLAVIDGLGDPQTILTAEDPYGNVGAATQNDFKHFRVAHRRGAIDLFVHS